MKKSRAGAEGGEKEKRTKKRKRPAFTKEDLEAMDPAEGMFDLDL